MPSPSLPHHAKTQVGHNLQPLLLSPHLLWLGLVLLLSAGTDAGAREPSKPRLVCRGSHPWISPDGRLLALAREEADPTQTDEHGRAAEASRIWVHDRSAGTERKLSTGSWVRGWSDAHTIITDQGELVDAMKSTKVGQAPMPPEHLHLPASAWLPGGKAMVYIGRSFRLDHQTDPPPDRGPAIYIVRAGKAPSPVAIKHQVRSRVGGVFMPARDGRHVLFQIGFYRWGNLPNSRVGILDIETGMATLVAEYPERHGMYRIYGGTGGARIASWDANSKLAAFVLGRGGGQSDVHVTTVDGRSIYRLTDDDRPKWQPAIDASGERVAFWSCRRIDEDGDPVDLHIRLIHLRQDLSLRFEPPEKTGFGSSLQWDPKRGCLLYHWQGREAEGIYEQSVLQSPPPGAGVPIRNLASSLVAVVCRALVSGNDARVRWGIDQAGDLLDPELIPALRVAVRQGPGRNKADAISILSRMDAVSALPEVMQVAGTSGWMQHHALEVLGRWRHPAALALIRSLRQHSDSEETRLWAAGALLAYGEEQEWEYFRECARHENEQVRDAVTSILGGVRDSRSVDILIPLVEDNARLYTTWQGEERVWHHAEAALAKLTGKTFVQDVKLWRAWWRDEAKGALPEVPRPNSALNEIRERRGAEGKARQREMKKDMADK